MRCWGLFIQVNDSGLDGIQQPLLAFLTLLDLAVNLIDAFLLAILGDLMRLRSASIITCNRSGANITCFQINPCR